MEIVRALNKISLVKNKIEMQGSAELNNSTICFKGENNILFMEDGVKIVDSDIIFGGNNSIVYLSKSDYHKYKLHVGIFNNSVLYVGKNNYFNNTLNISVDEMQNVIIGSGCLFSLDIWIRTGDPHLIYDCDDKKRINPSKSILIGDHVWMGQSNIILKGSAIGSGSIVGASSVVSGKTIESNSLWLGNPVRRTKDKVFFLTKAVHAFVEKDVEMYQHCDTEDYIYERDHSTIDFNELDYRLKKIEKLEEKIDILSKMSGKNRFYIGKKEEKL